MPAAIRRADAFGKRPLRGALLGAGNIAGFHLTAWQNVPGVEIVAVCDRQHERAVSLGREFGIDPARAYDMVETLLDREEIDFVDIATPPPVHAASVAAAAERGVHVFCQKPFATSLDEARQMIATGEAAGVRCVVNENWRWRRWYREVKRLIDAGTIGTPQYARFTWHADDALPGADGSPSALLVKQPYTAALPRLILFEWGIHLVDVLRFLLGDVLRVSARTARQSPAVSGEDLAVVTLEFESGALGMIDISWGTPVSPERRFIRGMVEPFFVEGSVGTIELDPFDDDALSLTNADRSRERRAARGGLSRPEAYQECFTNAHRHFAERLRDGRPAENEAADNWNTLATVFAAYESAATGHRIDVPPLACADNDQAEEAVLE